MGTTLRRLDQDRCVARHAAQRDGVVHGSSLPPVARLTSSCHSRSAASALWLAWPQDLRWGGPFRVRMAHALGNRIAVSGLRQRVSLNLGPLFGAALSVFTPRQAFSVRLIRAPHLFPPAERRGERVCSRPEPGAFVFLRAPLLNGCCPSTVKRRTRWSKNRPVSPCSALARARSPLRECQQRRRPR